MPVLPSGDGEAGGISLLDPTVRPNIRLIAADMDGTLLDDVGELHAHFWLLIDKLHDRGVLFCPASSRQYYKLGEAFSDIADRGPAEDGNMSAGQHQALIALVGSPGPALSRATARSIGLAFSPPSFWPPPDRVIRWTDLPGRSEALLLLRLRVARLSSIVSADAAL